MVTRILTTSDFDAVHAAFLDAFSDYVIPFSLSREQLAEMLTRRGWVPEASVVEIDDDRIVAFTLNGIDGTSAYDSGTGVVPSHRRRGLAAKMMNESFHLLASQGCTRYVLEVIDANAGAIALYRSLGFEETRGLQCWSLTSPNDDASLSAAAPRTPSWQNSDTSLARARERHARIEDDAGAVILFPATGEIAQFHGTISGALLARALRASEKPLRMLNVDERDTAFAAFLERAGAQRTVRQLEMFRPL